jgi:hypothetical protein
VQPGELTADDGEKGDGRQECRHRSTSTPEISPSSSHPDCDATSVSATSRGSRVSDAASSGSAPNWIPSPTNEADAAAHITQ